jgi:mercuric ion binding protein
MKLLLPKILLVIVLVAFFVTEINAGEIFKNKTVKIKCTEMTCLGCKEKITESINTLDGIVKVNVNLKSKIITVTFDESKTNTEKIVNAITDAGYESEIVQ